MAANSLTYYVVALIPLKCVDRDSASNTPFFSSFSIHFNAAIFPPSCASCRRERPRRGRQSHTHAHTPHLIAFELAHLHPLYLSASANFTLFSRKQT